jgi:hypothetical protein
MLLPLKWPKPLPLWSAEMQNPRNLSVHPHQGRQLPHNWAATAAAMAQSADAAYLQNLENAWRGPLGKQVANPGRDARLTNDRADSSPRMDSALSLVFEDGQWEVFQDDHGRTVRRRKK